MLENKGSRLYHDSAVSALYKLFESRGYHVSRDVALFADEPSPATVDILAHKGLDRIVVEVKSADPDKKVSWEVGAATLPVLENLRARFANEGEKVNSFLVVAGQASKGLSTLLEHKDVQLLEMDPEVIDDIQKGKESPKLNSLASTLRIGGP